MLNEPELRRRWYQAHVQRFLRDESAVARRDQWLADTVACAPEALEVIDRLGRSGELSAFKAELQAWSVKPTTVAFNGFNGQMFVNQLLSVEGDHDELARILVDGARLPTTTDEVRQKLAALVDYTESVRTGPHPSPGRVPFLLSYFWSLQDPARWPVNWASAQQYLETFNGLALPSDPVERYLEFVRQVAELDDDPWAFGAVASWWEKAKPVFLEPVLCDRCAIGGELREEGNARALVGYSKFLANTMAEPLASALGRRLQPKAAPVHSARNRFRGDGYADWWIPDMGGLGFRVWLNPNGVGVGIRPGYRPGDWLRQSADIIRKHPIEGYELLASQDGQVGRDVGFAHAMPGEFLYGKWFDRSVISEIDLPALLIRTAVDLQPLLDRLCAAASGGEVEDFVTVNDPLASTVEEFLAATGYPEAADDGHRSDRELFARQLQPETLATIDPAQLRRMYNSGRYGSPGPQSILNVTLRDADGATYDHIVDSLHYLLWGNSDSAGGDGSGDSGDAQRIDALLAPDRKIAGLGESVMMKLLAIAHPDRYVPIFPWGGPMGKRRMLQVLGLDEPTGSRGHVQVESSRAIYRRLNRFFPGDPWGMSRFCYWLSQRDADGAAEIDDLETRLDEMADELLVDRAFLAQIVDLLTSKGQVILYGPPGTGKTFLARRLAEALAPDPQRRKIVQFHPSTSYEDFFEGYRPEPGVEGDISYRLTPGPLALLAEEARNSPGTRHVMLIDEINRANLPKVFGELLFLLEYRGEAVSTLYRPDDPFELPKDLLFIGTMNTADRSIALVDAALRRRFHFIPFFPHDGAIAGLLDRWLEREQPAAAWVGELVQMVNHELSKRLGGPHLQIGPSYFMQPRLDEVSVRVVWEYNIEPFVEDQLFGDAAQIEFFRFDRALARYRQQVPASEPTVVLPSDGVGLLPDGDADRAGATLTPSSD